MAYHSNDEIYLPTRPHLDDVEHVALGDSCQRIADVVPVGRERCDEDLDHLVVWIDDDVDVSGGPWLAVEGACHGAGDHIGNASGVERGDDGP
jgi:hypothetical protein